MRFGKVRSIFKKEVLDTLRDRRTIMMMIVVPVVLYPGLMILISQLSISQQAKMEKRTIRVAMENVPRESALALGLEKAEKVEVIHTDKPIEQLKNGDLHFFLKMPPGWQEILKNRKTARLELHYDHSNEDAVVNLERIQSVIEKYKDSLLQERLQEKAISKEFVNPVEVKEVNVATREKMGGFLISRFLPMFMVIMILAGAMYPAIDMTAGEKERGTLETILTSPATRTEIVLGKFLTVVLIAMITGLLNMGSMLATFSYGMFRQLSQTIQVTIPPHFLAVMFLCMIPLAVFFSGLMMAVASFARSFKEAQNLLMPVYLAGMMPAMVGVIPGIQLEGFWLLFPVANVTLLFKELMLGVFNPQHILGVFLFVAFLASVALALAVNLFGREEVLFGEVSSFGLSFKRSNIVAKPVPDAPESFFFTAVSLILFLYVGIPLQVRNLGTGLILTQLIIFLGLSLGFALYMKLDLRHTFRLAMPKPQFWVVVLLFLISILFMASTILYLQNLVLPLPLTELDQMEKLLDLAGHYPFYLIVLVVATLPAICEELSFRGVIFSGLLRRFRPAAAIVMTAAIFAAFHLSLYRFLPVFMIGCAATYLVWRSGSIFTAMALHLLNNGTITFLSRYPQYDAFGLLKIQPMWGFFAAGFVLLLLGIFIARKNGT